ncbi:diaminopimelate epimerase [bacterium]|nr:diaminopimelate epimerase [bacterium]
MIQFSKMHGTGNDFIVIDGVTQHIHLTRKLIQRLAHRQYGIGADQILLLEPPADREADFLYRIFNPDGTEVAQCGNGARCIARFVYDLGLSQRETICFETLAGHLWVRRGEGDQMVVTMGVPSFQPEAIPISASPMDNGLYLLPLPTPMPGVAVSIGNPHCVITTPQIQRIPLGRWAQRLQEQGLFPEGVNLTVMQVLARNHIRIRTHERGAGETLSCGSAACASVIAGIRTQALNSTVRVETPGGPVSIEWPDPRGPVYLSGPTAHVFRGYFSLHLSNESIAITAT